MYLRVTQRRNADRSIVRYYQLAENVWDSKRGCAVAKIIFNFGRADGLDLATLRRLAESILRVCGEEHARTDAAAGVGPDDVHVRDAWPFGGVYVLEQLWRELRIDAVLWRSPTMPISASSTRIRSRNRCSASSPT
jgi:hypothetical protein